MKWLRVDVRRDQISPDMINSLGAFSTFCEIKRNNAEQRVRTFLKTGVFPTFAGESATDSRVKSAPTSDETVEDFEGRGRSMIARKIEREFVNHDFAALIEAILKVQGYQTHFSPSGPDGGVDILAAPGTLGFGTPRLCVQVKSGDTKGDQAALNGLRGAASRHGADQCLLVAWAGFTPPVEKARASEFFKVRLWDKEAILDELFQHYEKLDEDIRTKIPLKRVWTLADAPNQGD